MNDIEFIVDDLKLKGNLFYPEKIKEKNPGILFIHGWTSEKSRNYQYAKFLIKHGFIVMVFDMGGHGISEGDINTRTPKEFLKDCIAAYDYFSNVKGVDKDNINIVGSSFGSYLGSILTSKRKVKNIVLRVPADYTNDTFEKSKMGNAGENNKIYNWRLLSKKYNDVFAYKTLHEFNGNILIIESEKDTIVPHQSIQNYINAVKNKTKLTHIVVKGAPHSIKPGPYKNEVTKIIVKWFENKF